MIQVYQKPLIGRNIGVVFGAFAPLHQGHLDQIMRAKKENDACLVIVCGGNPDRGDAVGLPFKRRYRYVREFFAEDDLVAVYGINDTEEGVPDYPNGWDRWLDVFDELSYLATRHPDTDEYNVESGKYTFYVGEPEYAEVLKQEGYNVVLLDRTINPISATKIRENPFKYWNQIALPFRRAFSHNILITGTASEGKSTLVQDLGKYFSAPVSYEWARNYMAESSVNDNELDSADYFAFLYGQYALNKGLINSPANRGVFFADTDAMTTLMYAEHYAEDPTCILTLEEASKIRTAAIELTHKSRWDKIFVAVPHGTFVDDHVRYMLHSSFEERSILFERLGRILETCGYTLPALERVYARGGRSNQRLICFNRYVEDKVVFLNGTYYENFLTIKKYVEGLGYE